MKNFTHTRTTNEYAFHIYFIDPNDKGYSMETNFSTSAPHYEAAVAQALAWGQEIVRKAQKYAGQKLFMRVCKA